MYQSNALIGMVSQHMTPYRFSDNEAKEVGMHPEDTGVIVSYSLLHRKRADNFTLKARILHSPSGQNVL